MKQEIQKVVVTGYGSHEFYKIRCTILFETVTLVTIANRGIPPRLSNNILGKMSRFIFRLLGYVKSSIKTANFIIPLRS